MIETTIIAKCDNEDPCPAALIVPLNTTQQWNFLREQGWDLLYPSDTQEIHTVCPNHKETL